MLDLAHAVEPRRLGADLEECVADARRLSLRLFALAQASDRDAHLSDESLEALHDSGLALAPFPRRLGGIGLVEPGRACELASVLRAIGAGDLSAGRLFEGHVNAVALVRRYGREEQVAALADAVRNGALSAVWNAEGARPLSAICGSDGWTLSGEKILCSGAGLPIRPLVTPRTAEGVVMLLADRPAPRQVDVSRWTPLGMQASATGTVDFEGVVLPDEARIGGPGDYLRQPVFSGGAWRFCAVHLGGAERLLDLFRAQLRQRNRAGDPYQKQRVALATAACVTARLWIEKAATLLDRGEDDPEGSVALTNLTRMVTERACLDVIELVQRGVGLGAFMRPEPMERVARDLATYLRQPVPDAAMADAAGWVVASDAGVGDLWDR